jgi:carboxyl-terminal processing protease
VKPDVDVPVTKEEKLRLDVEFYKRQWVAGKPSAVGPNPPQPTIPKGPDGKPVVDESKPFVDQQLQRAVEVLKTKLRGAGAAPRRPRGLPMSIAA